MQTFQSNLEILNSVLKRKKMGSSRFVKKWKASELQAIRTNLMELTLLPREML